MKMKMVFDSDDFSSVLFDAVTAYNNDEKICNKIIFDVLNTGKIRELIKQKVLELADIDYDGDDVTEALAETVEEICTEYSDLLVVEPPADDEDRDEESDLPDIIETITEAFEAYVDSLAQKIYSIVVTGFMGSEFILSEETLKSAEIVGLANEAGDMMSVDLTDE